MTSGNQLRVRPWPGAVAPSPEAVHHALHDEGLEPRAWSNGPDEKYVAHSHSYRKVLFCVAGSIRFDAPETGESVWIQAGDRLEIPAGFEHAAVVGSSGCNCMEASAQ